MIKGFNPDRTPFDERPTEYRWKASHGRYLRPVDMTDEHLINTLNWIERGSPLPGVPNSEQAGQGHHYLRLEAMRRGIRWRFYANQTLNDGDLAVREAARIRTATPSDPTLVALGAIRVGYPFMWGTEYYLRVCPYGEVLEGLHQRGHVSIDGGRNFTKTDHNGLVERSIVVKLRTGSCYMMPNYQQVLPTVVFEVKKTGEESGQASTMEAWGPEFR